jgi:hypothetical protein
MLALYLSERMMRQFSGATFEEDLRQATAKLGEKVPGSAVNTLGPEPRGCTNS